MMYNCSANYISAFTWEEQNILIIHYLLIHHYLLTVFLSNCLRLICRCLALSRMSEASPMPDVTYKKMNGEILIKIKRVYSSWGTNGTQGKLHVHTAGKQNMRALQNHEWDSSEHDFPERLLASINGSTQTLLTLHLTKWKSLQKILNTFKVSKNKSFSRRCPARFSPNKLNKNFKTLIYY